MKAVSHALPGDKLLLYIHAAHVSPSYMIAGNSSEHSYPLICEMP